LLTLALLPVQWQGDGVQASDRGESGSNPGLSVETCGQAASGTAVQMFLLKLQFPLLETFPVIHIKSEIYGVV
jgi:hypothetical protein